MYYFTLWFLSLDTYKNLRTQLLKKVTIIKVIKIFEKCFEKLMQILV